MFGERGLSKWVEVKGVEDKGAERYVVGLIKHAGQEPPEFCSFSVDALEVSKSVHYDYISIEALKPFIRREVLKLFPE